MLGHPFLVGCFVCACVLFFFAKNARFNQRYVVAWDKNQSKGASNAMAPFCFRRYAFTICARTHTADLAKITERVTEYLISFPLAPLTLVVSQVAVACRLPREFCSATVAH